MDGDEGYKEKGSLWRDGLILVLIYYADCLFCARRDDLLPIFGISVVVYRLRRSLKGGRKRDGWIWWWLERGREGERKRNGSENEAGL